MKKPIVNQDLPGSTKIWTDPGGCNSCRYCTIEPIDMDPVCNHPIVLPSHPAGLYINSAIRLFCGNPHTLWRKK